uniref:RNA-directed DNA polymerase, eukaryota n=1 Tax=Tanacetum cinerariifolium TaxID=118510 RepID=A0A6L2KBE5_TANCI|nr:RNA-directed DNA polymerase, eukaryota [Tanacetum cinerariifolium]
MFYADDAIFVGQWSESNINTIVHVLDCFHQVSGLRINMSKSKLMGISVDANKVDQAAMKIGCVTLKTPFTCLGSKVGGLMSPDMGEMENMLASKEKRGLRISSLNVLNRALMFKWVWRFFTQSSSLWARVIKAIHGEDGKIGKKGLGEFSVASVRKLIDDNMLLEVASKTRWIKAVPIKVNVYALKVKLDCLPTRLNISRRGMDIESIRYPMCGEAAESTSRIFFTCHIAREILRKIFRWWDVIYTKVSSYEEWLDWILNLRLSGSNTEVKSCSKNYAKTHEKLQRQFDEQRQTLKKANLEIVAYQLSLESVEAQLIVHQKNEVAYEEKIAVLEFEVKDKGYGDQMSKSNSEVLPSVFDGQTSDGDDNPTNDRFKKDDRYHAVPLPLTGNYMPPLAELSFAGLDDSIYKPTANKASV